MMIVESGVLDLDTSARIATANFFHNTPSTTRAHPQ
jgi:hypothetical protein